MEALPICTYQFSIALMPDRRDLTLSIIDLQYLLSDHWFDAIIIVHQIN